MALPRAPQSCKAAGRRLWKDTVAAYDLDEGALCLLRNACHVADTCAALQEVVDKSGPLVRSRLDEVRVNPLIIELRSQRVLLERLLRSLNSVPESTDLPGGVPHLEVVGGAEAEA